MRSDPVRAWGPTARLISERLWRRRQLTDPALDACRRLALPGSTAVDVGAESGLYSLALRNAVGRHGHVVSFEPNPKSFEELTHRTWATGIDRRQVAVSTTPGHATLHLPPGAMQQSSLAGLGSLASEVHERARSEDLATHMVRTVTLDSLLDEPVPPPSLIKIDVEGWEREVLLGAQQLIGEHHPTLVVEIESRHLRRRGIDSHDLVESVIALGYSATALSSRGLISWSDFSFERHQADRSLAANAPDPYVHNFLFTTNAK